MEQNKQIVQVVEEAYYMVLELVIQGTSGGVRTKFSHRGARRQRRNGQGSTGAEPLDRRTIVEGSSFNSTGGQRTTHHRSHNSNGGS